MFTWRRLKGPRVTPLLGYVRSDNKALGAERACLISPRRQNGNLNIYLQHHRDADRLKLVSPQSCLSPVLLLNQRLLNS